MILVTGAAGQIGSYVLEHFADAIGVDLKLFGGLPIEVGDLRDYDFVKKVVNNADAVIHLAAQVSVERSWEDPIFDLENNIVATLNLLKASVSSARVTEFVKLMEGCYRDVNIALANELFKIASELGIDFYEAREYANHEYCHIHMPSTGVGGHCIPVYPWFLIKEIEKKEKFDYVRLLRTAREINDEMINYWAEKIITECLKVEKPIKDVKIYIKGITFRKGVKELYHSRNLALAKLLMKKGLNVFVYDELFSREEIERMGLRWIKPDEADIAFDCFELKIVRPLKESRG